MTTAVRRSSWIVTLPVTAAGIAYVTFGFLPQHRAIGEIRDEVRSKQQYVVDASHVTEALQRAETELSETLEYNAAWEQSTPTERDLSATYGTIHALAESAEVTITRFDPEPVLRYEQLSHAPLRVGCVGSFGQISGFLEAIERLPLDVWVRDFHLERDRGDGHHVVCELILAVFASNSDNSDYAKRP